MDLRKSYIVSHSCVMFLRLIVFHVCKSCRSRLFPEVETQLSFSSFPFEIFSQTQSLYLGLFWLPLSSTALFFSLVSSSLPELDGGFVWLAFTTSRLDKSNSSIVYNACWPLSNNLEEGWIGFNKNTNLNPKLGNNPLNFLLKPKLMATSNYTPHKIGNNKKIE